jgi:predicted alpha-1,2-mannosidase
MKLPNTLPPWYSRRSFLKTSGLAAAATVSGATIASAEAKTPGHLCSSVHDAATNQAPSSPVTLVNILQGTDSTPYFSRGNTLPIATRPFGMGHWVLQSSDNSPWMFQPGMRRLQGFRCTHQLSPWLGDYGQATFLPICGEANQVNPSASGRASSYRPEDSTLSPHVLDVRLTRYGVSAELIPTERCALLSIQYSKAEPPGLVFDFPGKEAPVIKEDKAGRTISFESKANSGGVQKDFAAYYVLRFSEPWTDFGTTAANGHHLGQLHFDRSVRVVKVKIGTSFISFDQASRNIDLEIGSKSPEALRREGEEVWNSCLRRIEIAGATPEQQRIFYSCLYRTLLFPRMWHEQDANGAMQHRSVYTGKVIPGVMYADHGYWDVYRAWYPMMSVLFPERLGEILQAWVNIYKEGGWLPQFPCPGYRACMTGSLIDSVFGEAAAKSIPGFDMEVAYAGLKKHATERGDPDAGYGRRGIEEYLKYGYAPAGLVDQAAAETVDAAYGDFCIAQVAKALGKTEDYRMFMKRSESWRHLFDPKTGFIRGKKQDGSWLEPFDPVRWGDPYVEGAAWQHRWDVPHDIPALIKELGGEEKTVAALEQMLTIAPDFNTGSYGSEIHEMSEMAAVRFGQYAHSNQPVHHVLYIFSAAGRQDRSSYWSRRVMQELYTVDGFAGDEDTGSMAAWYVLSALGFFPLCPGKPEYQLGGALFPRATVHLPGGKTLIVENTAKGTHATTTTLNGKLLTSSTVSHTAITAGGHLRFS